MIRNKTDSALNLHHSREETNAESVFEKGATRDNTGEKEVSLTTEEDSEDELYGLALMLRNTNNVTSSDFEGNVLSDQTNRGKSLKKHESRRNEEGELYSAKCFPNVNRRLVIHKGFYFFFFSALGSLFPYLAVFYKQLWLSARETGILIGIRPLIQLLVTPMWGVIADTYKRSKVIFIMSLVSWLVSNYSLSLVSPVFHLGDCKDNGTMEIIAEIIENNIQVNNSTSVIHQKLRKPVVVNPGVSSEQWFEIVGNVTASQSSDRTIISKQNGLDQSKRSRRPVESNQNTPGHDALNLGAPDSIMIEVGGKNDRKQLSRTLKHINSKTMATPNIENSKLFTMAEGKLTKPNFKASMPTHNKKRSMPASNDIIFKTDFLKRFRNLSDINIDELSSQIKRERIEKLFDFLNMVGEYPWPLDTVANYGSTQASYDWKKPTDEHLFMILFVITATGELIAAPATTLADTATLQNLGNRQEDYGKQRLWGAFGWGLAAFVVGASISTIEEINNCNNPLSVNYLPCFYVFACLMGVALLIGALFEFDEKKSQEEGIWQGLVMLFDCRYIYFIWTILLCGSALGFIQTFLFWHLQDLGGSQLLFSIITAIHCISEVMVYCFSGYFIKWIGHHQVLYVGLSCYIIRFFGYAFITNSWIVLPFEILHGLSTAAVWSAAVVFVGLIPGAPATMQGILGGVHWGLGNGGGGVVGGLLITYAGATTSFLIFGVVSLVDLTLFVCLNNMECFTCFRWSKKVNTRSQHSFQEDRVDEDDDADYDDFY